MNNSDRRHHTRGVPINILKSGLDLKSEPFGVLLGNPCNALGCMVQALAIVHRQGRTLCQIAGRHSHQIGFDQQHRQRSAWWQRGRPKRRGWPAALDPRPKAIAAVRKSSSWACMRKLSSSPPLAPQAMHTQPPVATFTRIESLPP